MYNIIRVTRDDNVNSLTVVAKVDSVENILEFLNSDVEELEMKEYGETGNYEPLKLDEAENVYYSRSWDGGFLEYFIREDL